MRKEDLVPVDAAVFYEGMYIESEIYFKYEKSFILLCRDVTLSSALINKFHQTEWASQQLYVDKNLVSDIMVQSEQFKKLNEGRSSQELYTDGDFVKEVDQATYMMDLTVKLNLQREYQELRERLSDMMTIVEKEQRIPKEISDALVADINTKIDLTEPSLLIQCINNLRPPDDYLHAHATNVAILNGMLGEWLQLPKEDVDALIQIGLLHDIGKLRIPESVLNKPSKLTSEEFGLVKKHPVFSYEILKISGETDERILEGILSHHERMNGTGYPSGLHVEQLSIFSRVTAVSDVYDAMVAKRPYKDRHSPFDILAEFALHKFSDLDISIINVFLDKMPTALLGKRVLLSDGRSAEVVFVNPQDFAHPIVQIDESLISTSPSLHCVAMENFLAVID